MMAKTAWAGGSLAGAGAFTPASIGADFAGLANLSSVLCSITFDNTVATLVTPDQFMDLSFVGTIASSTITSGAAIGLWMYVLEADGTTIGGGRLVAGTQTVFSPLNNPIGGIPIEVGTTIVNIAGSLLNITIPPRKFTLVAQNQVGFALATGLLSASFYRQNVNA